MYNFSSLQIKIASPDDILEWSYGEVTKPETINYRTQKPERDGLFSEAIFGPTRDWQCYCGKYGRIRYKGIICDRCGVEVTRSIVRRERMGHIQLASPVAHIWFFRGIPSRLATILNVSVQDLEKVVYFAGYIILNVNEDLKTEAMKKIESEFRAKIKAAGDAGDRDELREQREREKANLKSLSKYRILSEIEFRELSLKYGEVFEAGIGAESIRDLLAEMDLEAIIKEIEDELKIIETASVRKKIHRRLKLIKGLSRAGLRPEWMILTALPVIPPALRPMVQLEGGRYATSDLNDLYRRVINRNNRLKHLIELNAPEVITKNEKRMLQEAVDALIDNSMRRGQTTVAASTGQRRALRSLADMLKGKQGRFRQNLLGKRVDYSGRSVIVIGPELNIYECGLPKYMTLELFKPFVINKLIERELAHNIRSANRLIEQGTPEVWEVLEKVIENKLVLLNRAPTLHRLGVQAFKPRLIEGKAIRIPALPTRAFNADFDGDQMAVHLPITDAAQKEAHERMYARHGILKPSSGDPVAGATHDMTFGCFYLTSTVEGAMGEGRYFSSESEAGLAYEKGIIDVRAKIKVKINYSKKGPEGTGIIETSMGRMIFNRIMPEDFPYINRALKQSDLRDLGGEILVKYGEDQAVDFLDKVKNLGFHYATVSGLSWSMADIRIPKEKTKLISDADKIIDQNQSLYDQGLLTPYEKKTKAIELWTHVKSELEGFVRGQFTSEDPVFMMVESKARGNWSTVNQLSGMRGLMTKPDGELMELPVKGSFKEGLNVLEYFISTHGARKGLVDTALKTATAGYLTRRLVDVAQDVVVREEDCQDTQGYLVRGEDGRFTGETLGRRVIGRTLAGPARDKENKIIARSGTLITGDIAQQIDAAQIQEVSIRSLITCKSVDGICQKCYGIDLSKNKIVEIGEAVGIVTAQAIGEPGTQLTMRTFHTGGVASGSDITMGLPRVEEIFEARSPSAKAVVSDVDGKVIAIEESDKHKTVVVEIEKGKPKEFLIPNSFGVAVETGELITVGQALSEGHIDLKDLFKLTKDIREVARYIIREVQSVYFATGEGINEKHIELIVRQMFSRVKITNPGSTELIAGDVVERRQLLEANIAARSRKGLEAEFEQLLLGITRISLSTESFLSAASFQETARVLIDASTAGKEDKLRGLKENVIIGRLIPAGTGYGVDINDIFSQEEEEINLAEPPKLGGEEMILEIEDEASLDDDDEEISTPDEVEES
ncbi:MAG: DNA-directed RNA polymerase subunit beta' [Candidatus Yanofskybacteria bacterium CG10_big_fil_rev_8_21_14_0_10_46_23]|uniref:DNA-directed RNA polymerase subunit beta' n=1 Tax=Candidatus Yanofskybacteria bacterium CG10_big_fil_rev_8_21_14_0_10_46_23 TaxID=1975098 RepID=A0A2H0R711_9BACT|nr:MAG: DNA-directed RNA polymerase subunit beta' [Candidatus Yanofskybacteria bacterium CG10_big_fil_rev_8_21_14_0_10_46_23]